jgi:hypothetical protein
MKTASFFLMIVLVLVGCASPSTSVEVGLLDPTASNGQGQTLDPATTTPTVVQPTASPSPTETATQVMPVLKFPIRAAFYYPWFPQSWNQAGMDPFTHYQPTLGYYNQDDPGIIQQQVAAMQYGNIQLGIASWWGQGHYTDARVPVLLKAGENAGFQWALYIESEGQGDPSVAAIRSDLEYISSHYAGSPAYLKINGRFVVFVYTDGKDRCGMADRWKQANTVGAYLDLKEFPGYRNCASQPDGWHQYAPASPQLSTGADSFTISPGFWKATDAKARLVRDLTKWNADIKAMIASKADFQLITTFNEWGEGTAVESEVGWESPSGFGTYLDALHYNGSPPPG